MKSKRIYVGHEGVLRFHTKREQPTEIEEVLFVGSKTNSVGELVLIDNSRDTRGAVAPLGSKFVVKSSLLWLRSIEKEMSNAGSVIFYYIKKVNLYIDCLSISF